MNRREFLVSTAVAASARSAKALAERAAPAERAAERPNWRADFPVTQTGAYLNSAAMHPMSLPAAKALQEYIDAQVYRKTRDFDAERQADLKKRFAQLINAQSSEIAFVQNTSDGENIVVMGMELAKKGGNVVLDELHFETSLYMYKTLE